MKSIFCKTFFLLYNIFLFYRLFYFLMVFATILQPEVSRVLIIHTKNMPININDEVRIYPPRLSAVRKHTPQSLYIIYSICSNYASHCTWFFIYAFSFCNFPLIPVATILLYIGNGNSWYKSLIHSSYSFKNFTSIFFGY